MGTERQESYLDQLIKSEGEGLEGLEKQIFEQFVEKRQEVARMVAETRRFEDMLNKTKERINNLAGQCDGMAAILIQQQKKREEEQAGNLRVLEG